MLIHFYSRLENIELIIKAKDNHAKKVALVVFFGDDDSVCKLSNTIARRRRYPLCVLVVTNDSCQNRVH
jgi:hypothetical protein